MQLQPTNNNLPNGCVMTLKDVVDIINNERGVKSGERGFIQHGIAMKAILKLAETPRFHEVKKILTSGINNLGLPVKLETLALTKKQAIASAAKLDNSKLMFVIDKLEELEKKANALTTPQTYIEALKALVISEEAKQKALEERQKALKQVEQRDKTIAIVYHSQNSYTHTEVAQSLPVPISGKLFCKILNEAGIIYKTGNAWGLYSHYHGYKLSTIAEYVGNDGNTHISFRWTAKGKNWITKHWEEAIDRCSLESREEWEKKASRHEPKIPRKRKPKSPDGGED